MIEIDPTVDYVCKLLLGDPARSRLTIHFLNAVLRPKFPITAVEFFSHLIGATASSLRERLDSPVFDEAIGVLEMISQTPEQRRYYQARVRWELDENTRRAAEELARIQSREEGREEGKAEGKAEHVRMLQSLLAMSVTELVDLQQLSLDDLDKMIFDLQNKLRDRLR